MNHGPVDDDPDGLEPRLGEHERDEREHESDEHDDGALRDVFGFEVDLEAEVGAVIAQEAACLDSLELAEQLPLPSLDDFLS